MAHVGLRRKQEFWRRRATSAFCWRRVAGGGCRVRVGYKIGQTPAPPPIIINLPPQAPAK